MKIPAIERWQGFLSLYKSNAIQKIFYSGNNQLPLYKFLFFILTTMISTSNKLILSQFKILARNLHWNNPVN